MLSSYVSQRLLIVIAIALGAAGSVLGEETRDEFISLHPENARYFQWRGKPTVLVTSGEHYGAVLNLDFDYVRYLDELQRQGLNHTRVFTGVYREDADAFQITDNTLAPATNRFICPWDCSNVPGYHGGGNRFDLTQWDDDYFLRLKDFLRQAAQRGIVVELTLFCPMYKDSMWDDSPMKSTNNVNEVGDCGREEVYALKHESITEVQLAVTRKVIQELRDFGNLYYEVCNEPYFGGVTSEWQHRIVDEIVSTERTFPHKHLISLNVANGRQRIESPHPDVSIFNFHYCVPPDVVALNSHVNKVIGENETGFRGSADVLYRTEGWDFLMAGGALYNNLDYSFSVQRPDGTLVDYKSPGGGSVELRKQLGILKRFFDEMDFVRMKPDHSHVHVLTPNLTSSVLATIGKTYVVYLHAPLPNKPKKLEEHLRENIEVTLQLDFPAGDYRVVWLNPVTGRLDAVEEISHLGGKRTLVSPRFANDIALRVTQR